MRIQISIVLTALALLGGCAKSETTASPSPLAPAEVTRRPSSPAPVSPAPSVGPCVDRSSGPAAQIEIVDFRFVPDCVQMTSTQGFSLKNNGSVLHNFSVQDTGIDLDIQPGQENNTESAGLDPGIYTIFCKYHRDSKGMQGRLEVRSG